MLTQDLYSKILIQPALKKANATLCVVSGYATASMANLHLKHLAKQKVSASVELIVGMTGRDGIERAQHLGLCRLASSKCYGLNLSCRYVELPTVIHAKSYVWLNRQHKAYVAFCGSANYTLKGFSDSQIEVMEITDAEKAHDFYLSTYQSTFDCLDQDVSDKIKILEDRSVSEKTHKDLETISLSLLNSRTREMYNAGGGLNWGHRLTLERNKDQAYIHVPVEVQRSSFFPDRNEPFMVETDDGFSLTLVRVTDSGKGLHSIPSNAELGWYFRKRLGLKSGAFVKTEHLLTYGRTDVSFSKINSKSYLMDFSQS
ncbi:MAG: NgoFVII family restriction endonuclease [Gammaproteobacteria bacterium]|nr:NgoFVII family restriction endonuclease [Gammaproteobacteria bacterium]